MFIYANSANIYITPYNNCGSKCLISNVTKHISKLISSNDIVDINVLIKLETLNNIATSHNLETFSIFIPTFDFYDFVVNNKTGGCLYSNCIDHSNGVFFSIDEFVDLFYKKFSDSDIVKIELCKDPSCDSEVAILSCALNSYDKNTYTVLKACIYFCMYYIKKFHSFDLALSDEGLKLLKSGNEFMFSYGCDNKNILTIPEFLSIINSTNKQK